MNKLQKSYLESDQNLRVRRSIVGCILSITLVPAGVTLDYFSYPDFLSKFLTARLICSLLTLLILPLHYTNFGKKYIKYITFIWLTMIQITICYMIFATDKYLSTYYAGLNLVILLVAVVLPFSILEMLIFCVITIALYLFAASFDVTLTYGGILFNNLYFIVLTAIISATAIYLNSSNRFREFCLNYELAQKNKELSKMDKIKSQFFANISHEFRTPLTLILGPVQDILHSPSNKLPAKINNIFNTVAQNGLRLLKLVNDLLDIMRLQEGKTSLKMKKMELNNFISGMADSIVSLADMQQVVLNKDIAKKEIFINADIDAMEKIILNLLNNAIKFTPKNGNITISTMANSNDAVIKIKDMGIGIENDDLPYIFDRFEQVDNSSTREYQGTGLGLSLVKELAELQKGSVKAESNIKKGTIFTLQFPLFVHNQEESIKKKGQVTEIKDEAQIGENKLAYIHKMAQKVGSLTTQFEEEADNLNYKSKSANVAVKGLQTILVVDDEPDIRRYITQLLKDKGYNVFEATNGEEGLDMARKQHPDLIILDLMLPKIDGLSVCKTLKSNEETKLIKIILLTARSDEEAKMTALNNGADDFVTKPFSSSEVSSRVNNLLQNSHLQKGLHKSNQELEDTLDKLQSIQSQLIQSEKINALGSLSAGLIHEINNPLNYTMTALHLIKSNPAVNKDQDLQETVLDVEEGMERIKSIVTDLHSFAYPSQADKKNQFPVYSAIDNALKFTAHECKDIEIIINAKKDLTVTASKTHIVQILINLITNACKAILKSKNKGKITITANKKDNKKVTISVEDNGIGMDEAILKEIFNPFFTTNEVGQGIGLGLSVSHTIAKNHQSNLIVTSEIGKGSRFSFDLFH